MAAKEHPLLAEVLKGIFAENPIFVVMLGLCATLAVTTTAKNALPMGLSTMAVLVCSNVIISLLRHVIPSQVRIPCFIVVIASFVTMVELALKAYFPPALSEQLGIFIPLIVVNCIILGRAEAFASKNTVLRSFLDGVGSGLGFTGALLLVSSIREVLGNGTWWGIKVAERFEPAAILVQAPGAFLVLGLLMGFFKWMSLRRREKSS